MQFNNFNFCIILNKVNLTQTNITKSPASRMVDGTAMKRMKKLLLDSKSFFIKSTDSKYPY